MINRLMSNGIALGVAQLCAKKHKHKVMFSCSVSDVEIAPHLTTFETWQRSKFDHEDL